MTGRKRIVPVLTRPDVHHTLSPQEAAARRRRDHGTLPTVDARPSPVKPAADAREKSASA